MVGGEGRTQFLRGNGEKERYKKEGKYSKCSIMIMMVMIIIMTVIMVI